ncbi:MAG: PD40 domain-containing protein [Deltaproteobacteria bacterium]|nr:PD40 domain-containing protein [Deltaproteobacteria bacterium]
MNKSLINSIKTSLLLALLLLFPAHSAIAAGRVYLDITAPETRKINMAVPWFTSKNTANQNKSRGSELADTLAKALKFHGIISILPTKNYGGSHTADWKKQGVDYAVLGQYTASGDSLKLEMRLLDVASDEIIMGKSFSGSRKKKEEMLYKFCDHIIKTFTGNEGIANSKIVYVSRVKKIKEVYLTDILGKKVRQITRHRNLTVSPRFKPGGNFLTYTSYHTGNQNLYITDLRQSRTTRVLSRRKGLNLAPAWSPDGKYMILTLSVSGTPDLFLLDSKGKIIEQLTRKTGINVSPTWSPDGNHIVFVSDRSGKPQLYHMDLKSRKINRLTFEGIENAEPNWSPTDNTIVYSSLRDGVYQLFMLKPLEGGEPVQLTTDLSHHESPAWSPDGNQIIFAKRDGKDNHIYAILKNGSYQRRILNLPGSQTYPQWSR